jgi:hypothetical protein
MKKILLAFVLACLALVALADTVVLTTPDPFTDIRMGSTVERAANGTTKRSRAVIIAFRKLYACPSTGKRTGACPGWAIDHPIPLDCGGRDIVANMQWLPDQIKSAPGPFNKDHFERRVYGGRGISAGCP